jgi:hypothetical protein
MGQVLRMPSEAELPRGAHRDFTKQLFSLSKEARRPGLREISRAIPDDSPGTASTETIRRMLRGKTVPVHWQTVDTVLTALCLLAEVDPDEDVGDFRDEATRRQLVEIAWHRALDEPGWRAAPAGPADDPWDATEINGYKPGDEPPF